MKHFAKRSIALLAAAVLALSMFPAAALAAVGTQTGGTGSGTAADPYRIAQPEDLELLRQYPDATFELTADIDMDGVTFAPVEQGFTGTLDGDGHTIENLTITADSAAALFITLKNGGTNAIGIVKDLTFTNPQIKAGQIAAVVACANEGYISNVNVTGGSVTAGTRAGALTARQAENAYLQKSGSTAAVTANVAGGLAGLVEGGTIRSCFAGGKVTASGKNAHTGAVFGTYSGTDLTLSSVYYDPAAALQQAPGTDADGDFDDDALIGVTLTVPAAVSAGDAGACLAAYSHKLPANTSPAPAYGSSDTDILAVNASTGAYTAQKAGAADYRVSFKLGTNTYTVAASVTVKDGTGEVQDADGTSVAPVDGTAAAETTAAETTAAETTTAASQTTAPETTAASQTTTAATAATAPETTPAETTTTATTTTAAPTTAASTGEAKTTLPGLVAAQGVSIQNGTWTALNGKLYYTYADGTKAIGPVTIDGARYIFGTDGAVYRNAFFYEDCWYYANTRGVLYADCFITRSGNRAYYGTDGAARLGWLTRGSVTYYQVKLADGSYALTTGAATVDGKRYLFSATGSLRTGTGWVDGAYLQDGLVATGLVTVDGAAYILDENGKPLTGDFTWNGKAYSASDKGVLYLSAVRTMPDGTLRYYDADGQTPAGWIDFGGARYYQSGAFALLTGQQTIDGKLYFFGSTGALAASDGWAGDYYVRNGAALTGVQNIDGKTYIFNNDGLVQKGQFRFNGDTYCGDAATGALVMDAIAAGTYYAADGKAPTGWIDFGGAKYYQSDSHLLLTGRQSIGGAVYFFAADGHLMTEDGWAGLYYVKNGSAVTGRQTIDGKQYIFSAAGTVYRGEYTYNGGSYFADAATGALFTDYVRTLDDGTLRYYGADGKAPTGWVTSGDDKYYQTNGLVLATGAYAVNGVTYYFGTDGKLMKAGWVGSIYVLNGVPATGLQQIGGKYYVFSGTGLAYKFEFTYNSCRYYASSTGVLYTNCFLRRPAGITYYDEQGAARIGWIVRTTGTRYYQSESYTLLIGRQTVDGVTYFFGSTGALSTSDGWAGDYYVQNGAAVTGIQQIDGETYVFGTDGLVLKGDFTYDGAAYWADDTGKVLRSGICTLASGARRWQGADGKAAAGWADLDGKRYYQTDALVLATGRQTIDGTVYYFTADGTLLTGDGWAGDYYVKDGAALTGTQEIDGKTYIFGADGVVYKGSFQVNGTWYFADETGSVQKNVIEKLADGTLRLYGEDGAAKAGWAELNGQKYYQLADTLVLAVGRVEIDGKSYYFKDDGTQNTGEGWSGKFYLENGVPAVGRRTIDGKLYIFDDTTGEVQTGEFEYQNAWYWAADDGALWADRTCSRADGTRTFYDTTGAALEGWSESSIGQKYYQVAKDGKPVTATGFTEIDGNTYYFYASGRLFTGSVAGYYVIDGKQYFMQTDGRCVAPPTIADVTKTYDASKKVYVLTINSTISGATTLADGGSYSFDGGKTWQTGAVRTYSAAVTTTLAAGQIMVRDGVGQSVYWPKAITMTAVGSTGSSGYGARGVDVSMNQNVINWTAVKASGINFAIVRAMSYNNAYGGYYIDPYFETNVRNAKAAGINVGVYLFSYATSTTDITTEVNFFLNSSAMKNIKAAGIKFDYPVYIDYESSLNLSGTTYDSRTSIVRTGMQLLKNAGYYPGFYTYHSYMSYFNVAGLVNEGYDFWYARYPASPAPDTAPSIGTTVGIWQYCSDGNQNPAMTPYVNGISTRVDLNATYKDYPTIVHKFSGETTGTITTVTQDTLTVYDVNTSKIVTDNAAVILAKVVQNEVGAFNNPVIYKAQAVAAHSWILYQTQNGVTPSVGLSTPSAAVTAAVKPVANQILKYGNAVANTMYCSAGAGYTNSAANMWGTAYPYLIEGRESSGDLKATAYAAGGKSWYNRTTTISLSTMKSNMEKMVPGSTSGNTNYASWITNPVYDSYGYLTSITVMGKTIGAGKFYDNCWGLYSPNFTVSYNGNGTWTFVTKGNGHCVGMSQWGAYGYARQGYAWDWILQHYYPGTTLGTN